MNNADYGMTFQKVICDKYGIYIHGSASEQFRANYNSQYVDEIKKIVPHIFSAIGSEPEKLLTYTKYMVEGNLCTSPHNFLLKSGKTMSIRTMKKSDKVAPRTVGQAGYKFLMSILVRFMEKRFQHKMILRSWSLLIYMR